MPAESHGQIGQVERLIGTLKRKLMAHLRSSADSPEIAVWAMMCAHNHMTDVGGYSPAQWIFGRGLTDGLRLHDGPDLPYWSGMANSAKMQKQLASRLEAENHHRDFVMREKLNQALNTKMTSPIKYEPGALVFYKRYQPPADRKERSHMDLDIPRRRVARWYGPARVLALETKVTYDGHVKQPHNIAWIVASGRLKRVHTNQLRYASDRERLVAEGSTTPSTMPWTFSDISGLINKGEYDDEIMTDRQQRADARKSRAIQEENQRVQQQQLKRSLEETASSPTGHATATSSSTSRQRTMPLPAEQVPIETDEGDIAEDEEMDQRHRVREDLDVDDILDGPDPVPFGDPDPAPLFRHPLFLQARRQHEQAERPFHVQRQEFLDQRGISGPGAAHYAEETEMDEQFYNMMEQYAFAVTLPVPENENEWRKIVKDPSRFVAKKLAKGVEVSWQRLSQEQRAAMAEAKQIEIKEWISSQVVRAAIGPVPPERCMKMRWVLVLKGTDDPKVVKAKARLVVIGFTDPDYGAEETRSPTLTRRGRQCLLQMAIHRGWKTLKSDAKAAFLQTNNTQGKRRIFGIPVVELQQALGLAHGQAVQFLKAAYGLTVAPREFYHHVDGILRELKLHRLHVDPSIWVLRVLNEISGQWEVHGAV